MIGQLRDDIAYRRVSAGIERLESLRPLIDSLDPAQRNAAPFLGYLAQWVDIGFDRPQLIGCLLARFPKAGRAGLPLGSYVHLRMSEGLMGMIEGQFEDAVAHFQFVLSVQEEIADKELIAISNYSIGRCYRKKGQYDDALAYTERGVGLALSLGFDRMAAVMRVLESWLIFQEGKPREALRILNESEAVMAGTDDYVTRGNIQSAYGRIARREGRYDHALQRFACAIDEYKMRDPRHRNLARSLVNMAFVEHLLASQLRKRMDAEAARRGVAGVRGSGKRQQYRERFDRLREEALTHLAEAEEIYTQGSQSWGIGSIHVDRGFIYLDSGELERAGVEALLARELGERKKDYLLLARSAILQAMVESAKYEEQLDDPAQHAQAAHDAARDAVEYAAHTQNRRLLAKAYIWQGLALANDYFDNTAGARQCLDLAMKNLKPDTQDYVAEELQTLRGRILHAGSVDAALREWSHGITNGKTFQEIEEDFAGIIIPKVWEREGRKVSRVAERLSISPKKIRRILAKLGLM